jgi:hypothetical protein
MAGRQPTPSSILDDLLGPVAPAAPAQPEPTLIALADIVRNGGTQMRAALDPDTVSEYADAMHGVGWGTFPPIVVFYDGSAYHLGDGFHRTESASQAGLTHAPADVRSGTRRDAILFAAGANALHGLRRTSADKRRAVMALLEDVEWRSWSDNEIARRCNVSPTFVGNLRRSLSTVDSEEAPAATERTYTTRQGTTATMQVANIGKSKAQPETPKAETWQLEQVVGKLPNLNAARLRTDARSRSGDLFAAAKAAAEQAYPGAWSQTRLIQAMHNAADQMEQKAKPFDLTGMLPLTAQTAGYRLLRVGHEYHVSGPHGTEFKAALGNDAITLVMNWVDTQLAAVPAAPLPAATSLSTVDSDPRMPADLESLGWQLRQLGAMGRWYAHNASQHKATSPVDNWRDAIAAARDMQRNVLPPEDAAVVEQAFGPDVQAQPDPLASLPTEWRERNQEQAATMLAQAIMHRWPGVDRWSLEWKDLPGVGFKLSLGAWVDGSWHWFDGRTMTEVLTVTEARL